MQLFYPKAAYLFILMTPARIESTILAFLYQLSHIGSHIDEMDGGVTEQTLADSFDSCGSVGVLLPLGFWSD